MKDTVINTPELYEQILAETKSLGFDQLSDLKVGSFLASLCASKPAGRILELGTGTGLGTSWLLHGMSRESSLLTVDNQEQLVEIAKKYLSHDKRVEFVVSDGERIIEGLEPNSFDLVFADTWPGKYNHLEETIALLKVGGVYVIDDMIPQVNWPIGHDIKAKKLVAALENHQELTITKIFWSTGVILCVKNAYH